jgi:hypothetical protein
MYTLCAFPASAKLTQPDWMYTCWAAGLEPLAIYSYSQLYMLTWGSSVVSLPIGNLGYVYTQVNDMRVSMERYLCVSSSDSSDLLP